MPTTPAESKVSPVAACAFLRAFPSRFSCYFLLYISFFPAQLVAVAVPYKLFGCCRRRMGGAKAFSTRSPIGGRDFNWRTLTH